MGLLTEKDLRKDPIKLFDRWYKAAKASDGIEDASALCLSTIGSDAYPEGRMVLLKEHGPDGFVFYTNFRSIKGKALLARPKAAMTFYWEPLARQVRIVGSVKPVSPAEADEYFRSRPRLSQIGAWASHQSEVLASRSELERRFAFYKKKFDSGQVPRPSHWGGFRLKPRSIEFWQGRPNRLHDRILYRFRGGSWKALRLNP